MLEGCSMVTKNNKDNRTITVCCLMGKSLGEKEPREKAL